MYDRQLRLDLELALAQVRVNIQADCRVLDFGVTEQGFAVVLTVGENNGSGDWLYHRDILDGRDIPVCAVGVGISAEWEAYATQYRVEDFWAQHVEEITTEFFKRNPEYQRALE